MTLLDLDDLPTMVRRRSLSFHRQLVLRPLADATSGPPARRTPPQDLRPAGRPPPRFARTTRMSPGGKLDPAGLRDRIAGDLVTAQDPGWDAARRAWNLVADQHPELVVFAEAPDDIVATVRFARARGLRVAPQSTGHGATTLADLGGTG